MKKLRILPILLSLFLCITCSVSVVSANSAGVTHFVIMFERLYARDPAKNYDYFKDYTDYEIFCEFLTENDETPPSEEEFDDFKNNKTKRTNFCISDFANFVNGSYFIYPEINVMGAGVDYDYDGYMDEMWISDNLGMTSGSYSSFDASVKNEEYSKNLSFEFTYGADVMGTFMYSPIDGNCNTLDPVEREYYNPFEFYKRWCAINNSKFIIAAEAQKVSVYQTAVYPSTHYGLYGLPSPDREYENMGTDEPTTESQIISTTENTTEQLSTYTTESNTNAENVLYGDVNCDGTVDIKDAVLLNKYLVNSAILTDRSLENSDVDLDGKVDASDTLTIMKYLVGTYSSLPITL